MPVHSIGHSLNHPLPRIYTSGCCGDSRSGWRERWCRRSQRRRSKQQSFKGSDEKGRMVLKKREKVESLLSYGSSQEAKNESDLQILKSWAWALCGVSHLAPIRVT